MLVRVCIVYLISTDIGPYIDRLSASDLGWDVGRQNKEDPMHQVANMVKSIFGILLNVSKQWKYTKKIRKVEVKFKRFPELRRYEEEKANG